MKICILICGFLRSFKYNFSNLKTNILDKYDCDIFLHISRNKLKYDKYINKDNNIISQIDSVINLYDPISFIVEKECENKNELNEIEFNTIKYFYKLYQVNNLKKNYEYVNDFEYDIVILMRPDLYFKDDYDIIKNNINNIKNNNIIIPINELNRKNSFNNDSINDHLCIGSSKLINNYTKILKKIREYKNKNIKIISENILIKYLTDENIKFITDNKINYKLILSISNSIAVSGDSGSGKTTLCEIINNIFEETLNLECDRYHKWERNDPKWNQITHLNPKANYLLKMRKDYFDLKIGQDVFQVDYNHINGKFTQKDKIKSKRNIILCGLHTLSDKKIVNSMNINIYLDTDPNLKNYWKIKRDIKKRNYTVKDVLDKINIRNKDYKKYILSQRSNSDLIIKFYDLDNLELDKLLKIDKVNIGLIIYYKYDNYKKIISYLNKFNIKLDNGIKTVDNNNYYYLNIIDKISDNLLLDYINDNNIYINKKMSGYKLLLQIFIVMYY